MMRRLVSVVRRRTPEPVHTARLPEEMAVTRLRAAVRRTGGEEGSPWRERLGFYALMAGLLVVFGPLLWIGLGVYR